MFHLLTKIVQCNKITNNERYFQIFLYLCNIKVNESYKIRWKRDS